MADSSVTVDAVRVAILAVALSAGAWITAASGQQRSAAVTGRIVESGSDRAIAGATVELEGFDTHLSDDDGSFRFDGVAPGRYVLRVEALGYRSADQALVVLRDTAIVVALDVVPVALDRLDVRSRTATVRGTVRDSQTGIGLIDVDVATGPDQQDWTDPIGRFKLERVPAGAPFVITVRGYGYLPVTAEIVAERDTTLQFGLELDPLAQRMIAVQVERLEARARPHLTSVMRPITREDLMRLINWNVLDVIRTRYPSRVDRFKCILIDDIQTERGIEELGLMLPDRFERIEVLFRGAMLRLYTRDYIRRMSGGAVKLRPPQYVEVPGGRPFCR